MNPAQRAAFVGEEGELIMCDENEPAWLASHTVGAFGDLDPIAIIVISCHPRIDLGSYSFTHLFVKVF
jgi:hypothetical protein